MMDRHDRTTRERVLVVDDDALVAMGLVLILENLGYVVVEANTGQEALAILRRDEKIALLVTDQAMRGMSGTDLARAAMAFRPDLPIVLATGYRDVPEGAELGLPRLSKPYDETEVATVTKRALNRATA